MPEEWRPIKEYETQYAVSDHGRIMSLERQVCGIMGEIERCRIMPERLMVQMTNANDYKVVWLRRPGEHKKQYVHRLVAEAFLPNPAARPYVNHKDRDRQNNVLKNLEWVTETENTQHWMKHDRDNAIPSPVQVEDLILDSDLPFQ